MAGVWNYPTRIIFGAGQAAKLGEELASLGAKRPLIVTDAGVVRAQLIEPLAESLRRAGLAPDVFSGIQSNPGEEDVGEGVAAYRQSGADSLVAVGGGSPIDAAKLLAVRARVDRPWEELDDTKGGGRFIPQGLPPVVALPTTAGTGSEVGRSAVLTVRSTNRKTVIFAPHLMPRVAILDPELTVSMPPRTTAATGFDALTHCLEAFVAKGDHPMADAIAIGGLELIARHLETAVTDGNDLEARGGMMKAAMMGAVAFQKGLGACHSLAHPLSSECGLHHGLANALCLPAVVDFNEGTVPDRLARVAGIFGGNGAQGSASAVLRELRRRVGLPSGLAEANVAESMLAKLADLAVDDGCHLENPRPCNRDDLLQLYERSL